MILKASSKYKKVKEGKRWLFGKISKRDYGMSIVGSNPAQPAQQVLLDLYHILYIK